MIDDRPPPVTPAHPLDLDARLSKVAGRIYITTFRFVYLMDLLYPLNIDFSARYRLVLYRDVTETGPTIK